MSMIAPQTNNEHVADLGPAFQARSISKEPARLLHALLFERQLFATALADGAAAGHELVEAAAGAGGETSRAPRASSESKHDGAKAAAGGTKMEGWKAEAGRERGAGAGAGSEVWLAPAARAAFRGLCVSLVKVFVGVVKHALQTVTGEGNGGNGAGSGGLEAEWGAAAPMARRFVTCLNLLDMLSSLREAQPALAGVCVCVCLCVCVCVCVYRASICSTS
jgi:hypothetical protein